MKYKDDKIILLLIVITLIFQVVECRRYHETRTYRRSRGSDSSGSSSSDSSGSGSSSSDSSGSHSGERHRKHHRDSWELERTDRDRGNGDYWPRERGDRDPRERGRWVHDRWILDSQNRYDDRDRDAWNPFGQNPDKFPGTLVTAAPARRPLPPFPTKKPAAGIETISLGRRSEGQLPEGYEATYGQYLAQNPKGKNPLPSFSNKIPVYEESETKTVRRTSQNDLNMVY